MFLVAKMLGWITFNSSYWIHRASYWTSSSPLVHTFNSSYWIPPEPLAGAEKICEFTFNSSYWIPLDPLDDEPTCLITDFQFFLLDSVSISFNTSLNISILSILLIGFVDRGVGGVSTEVSWSFNSSYWILS